MRLTPMAAAAIAVASVLAACGQQGRGAAAATNGAAAAAAPANGPDVGVSLANVPRLKAGLWQSAFDTGDGKPGTMTTCVSGKAPALQHLPPCFKRLDIKRTFQGAYVVDSTCATPDFTMVSHAVMTGDFQSNMSSSGATTTTAKQAAPETRRTHIESHYVGPCPPGQAPDDEAAPSGGG